MSFRRDINPYKLTTWNHSPESSPFEALSRGNVNLFVTIQQVADAKAGAVRK